MNKAITKTEKGHGEEIIVCDRFRITQNEFIYSGLYRNQTPCSQGRSQGVGPGGPPSPNQNVVSDFRLNFS